MGQNMLLKMATLVVILAGIRAASDIIVPFLLAIFLAIILNPLVNILMRRGLRRTGHYAGDGCGAAGDFDAGGDARQLGQRILSGLPADTHHP